MPLYQFLSVRRRNGAYDPVHTIVAAFDIETGKLQSLSLRVPPEARGAVVQISRQEFKRQVALHGLQRTKPGDAEKRATDRKRKNEEYRAGLISKRPKRASRLVSKEIHQHVIERIAAGDSGVAISLALGVSPSYISRTKRKLKEAP